MDAQLASVVPSELLWRGLVVKDWRKWAGVWTTRRKGRC